MKFLITGGAGYIGSHLVKYLQSKDHDVIVIDNFSTGNRWALKNCDIYEIDLLDKSRLFSKLKNQKFDGVFHLAAKSLVSESFRVPDFYYQNNVVGTKNLLELMSEMSTEKIVFSSTAAIFGLPLENKVGEQHSKIPISPYGSSKLKAEQILEHFSIRNKVQCISLRYFNAAGADSSGELGEYHSPETHLIPRVCNSIISQNEVLEIFGKNYNTHDGTCIRDYVHVNDIVNAHILAFTKLEGNNFYDDFNLGNSKGFSVLEIIKVVERLSGETLQYKFVKERSDEPSSLVADNSKAIRELNWNIKYSNIEKIIKTSLQWHQNLKNGIHLN